MAGQDSRGQQATLEQWVRSIDKRLLHQERRPATPTATSLLGQGFAPFATELLDWNDDMAALNGMWFSTPGAGHEPTSDYYMGQTFGTTEGSGLQIAYSFLPTAGSWTPTWYIRRFYTGNDGHTRTYSDWTLMTSGGGGGGGGNVGGGHWGDPYGSGGVGGGSW